MRLLFTTIAAGVVLFMVVLMARIWGLGQSFPVFDHPFLAGNPPLMIVKAQEIPQIEAILGVKKDAIIWLDTRVSMDRTIFVLNPGRDQDFLKAQIEKQKQNPSQKILKGNKISDYDWKEISAFYPKTPTVAEVYAKFPEQRFMLNVFDNVMNVDVSLITALKDSHPDQRTFIQSDTLVVMTSIKDTKPEWVYGTSQADLMRFLTFNDMWILPTTQYKGDVFVAPFKILNRPAFNADVIAEMRRRHKKIFLGPIKTREELQQAKEVKAEGYITDNITELTTWLDQGPAQ